MTENPPARAVEDSAAAPRLPATAGIGQRSSDRRGEPAPYSERFRAVTAVLIGLAIAAIIVAVTLATTGSRSGHGGKWSSWSPADGGLTGENEIANQIAPFYRATPATQLVVVTVQNFSGAGTGSGTEVAIRDPSNGNLAVLPGSTAVYSLCGLGSACAVSAGTPSASRLLLLRREALELALFTFKYISGVQNVVALLPPGHTMSTAALTKRPPAPGHTAGTTTVELAVAFQRNALQPFLNRPLSATLPEQLPPSVAQMDSAPEAELVSIVTGQALFRQQLVQSQAGGNVLVLTPQPAQ